MSLLKRLIKGKSYQEEELKKTPAFRKLVEEMQAEENEFLERINKILPVINIVHSEPDNEKLPDDPEQQSSEGNLPVSFPVNFDNELSINLQMGNGADSEKLLNRHILVAKDKVTPDQLVSKAYGNLFRQIESTISISMITEEMGMLSNCKSHDASLVLVNEIWKLIRDHLHSDEIVFGIPAQDQFIFAAADSEEAVEQLTAKVNEYFSDSVRKNRLSPRLYLMRKDGSTGVFKS